MMIIFAIILALLVIAALAFYINFFIRRTLAFWKIPVHGKFFKGLLIAVSALIAIFSINVFSKFALVSLHIIIISLELDILVLVLLRVLRRFSFFKRGVIAGFHWKKTGKGIYLCGLLPVIFTIVILFNGYQDMTHVIKKEYTVETSKKLQKGGYNIAMISDLHYATTMSKTKLVGICQKISAERPDFVVLCGDIVDDNSSMQQMKDAFQALSGIKSHYGIYYIYGNHDRQPYAGTKSFTRQQLQREIEDTGIRVLSDATYEVNSEVVLLGREDAGWSGGDKRKSLKELLKNINQKRYLITLDHQPIGVDENIKNGCDLELSGHTHAGQIWPVGIINSIRGILNYGVYRTGQFETIVSSGIGGWGYPIRTEGHSEWVMIHLRHKG